MNLRIAYYVVAFAISLAAFAGAYGYASPATAVCAAPNAAAWADTWCAGLIPAIGFVYNAAVYKAALAGVVYDPTSGDGATVAGVVYKVNTISANSAAAKAAHAAARTAYGMAAAVALAAFAGAYILSKKAA